MARKRPIVLIPGIQGTKLSNVNEKDFDVVFSGIRKYYRNIHSIRLQSDGVTDYGRESIIERADVEDLAYSEIINYFRSRGHRVFIFGYDWRKSNIDSGKALDLFIKGLRNKTNQGSFNFVTHSMGCLVLSAYLKMLNPAERVKIVNKAIFTVPPFKGSIEASINLTIGKCKLFNASDDVRSVSRTFPAIYELLPVYGGAYEFENGKKQEEVNLYKFSEFWQQVDDADRDSTLKKHKLLTDKLEDLGEARADNDCIMDLAKCSKELRARMLVVGGVGSNTHHRILVKERMGHIRNYFDYEHFEEKKDGDGTVPIQSFEIFKEKILTLAVRSKKIETGLNSFGLFDWHSFFLNNGRVQNIIKRFIENEVLGNDWYSSLEENGVEKLE